MDVQEYAAAWDAAENLFAANGAYRSALDESILTRGLNPVQREIAYDYGKRTYEAKKEAIRKKAAEKGGEAKYSLESASKTGYSELIGRFYNNNLSRQDPIYVGRISEKTSSLIGSNAPLIITANNMRKSVRKSGNNKSNSAHAMPEDFIRTLPERLNNAVLAYTERRNEVPSFSYVVFNEYTGRLTVIGGELNAEYENREVNRIRTIFDIENPESFLAKEGKSLKTTDKKRAKELLEKARVQFPALQQILDSMEIITPTNENVKSDGLTGSDGPSGTPAPTSALDDGSTSSGPAGHLPLEGKALRETTPQSPAATAP